MPYKKAIIIVLDSCGIGALPDAAEFGDAGSNTMGRIADAMPGLQLPVMNGMGLHRLVPQFAGRNETEPLFPVHVARMAEQSRGKDTITGHWELAGVLTNEPSPTFPDGFPQELLDRIYQETGYRFLGNEVASGTEIIARLGAEHVRTGKPILYTSADSVLQIAAHEDVIPVPELYRLCEAARNLTRTGPYKVGRVIARPFIGHEGNYVRTANRHDFALTVPSQNLLQDLLNCGWPVYSVGKIEDIFSGVPFTAGRHTTCDAHGMETAMEFYRQMERGLLFVNLVDFDMKYGHRRDITGYGNNLAQFDAILAELLVQMDDDTILCITADHGCDPGFSGTDHTREYVPLFLTGYPIKANDGVNPRESFADLAATLADYFGVAYSGTGRSFASEVFHS